MFNQYRREMWRCGGTSGSDPKNETINMKQGQSPKRPRGHRGNGRRPSGGRNANFESSGPQGKIRGTAYQVIEKYQALGRDALTFGDRVAAENYFQHAEHYYRVMAANGGASRDSRKTARPSNRGSSRGRQPLRRRKRKRPSRPNCWRMTAPSAPSSRSRKPPPRKARWTVPKPKAQPPDATESHCETR